MTAIVSSAESLPFKRSERFFETFRCRIESTDCGAASSSAGGLPSGVFITSTEDPSPSESEVVVFEAMWSVGFKLSGRRERV